MEQFTGTREVADSHAFDIGALEAYLGERLPGFAGPLSVEQFKGGQSNPTYKLVTPGASYVMRSKPGPATRLLPSAHAIEREFRVMHALAGSEVPVAQMHLLCEDEAVIGRAFYVMQFMDGRVLWNQSLPGSSRAERGAIYDEMNRVMAALHRVDPAAVGLADFGKPGSYFERQIGRWSKQYLASVTESIVQMDRLIDWLPARLPPSARDASEVSIVHGDFRLDNMVFRGGRAPRDRGAGLGVVDARPPAGRLQLPLHGLAHPARRLPRARWPGPRRTRHSFGAEYVAALLRAHRPRRPEGA
jgi:aminoglycoside phosphotransferase (APT) family kinase protein